MIEVPYNDVWRKQSQNIPESTFKKGVIVNAYVQNWTADVYLIGSAQTIIKGVPFASSVDVTKVIPGARCRLDLFDETNPNDMVIAYTYGSGSSLSSTQLFSAGSANVIIGGITIAHGLGQVPQIVGFIKAGNPNTTLSVSGGTGTYLANIDVFEYQPADATNIYLKSVNGTINGNWFTIKF